VECTVFDPYHFDRQAKVFGMNPICNPMKETIANTLDTVSLDLNFDTEGVVNNPNVGYKYSGLIPQPDSPTAQGRVQDMFKSLPTELFASPQALNRQSDHVSNANFSLFAGVVAVLYDASKGVPTTLNFDNVRDNAMSADILTSTVLWQTKCELIMGPLQNVQPDDARLRCPQEKLPPVDFSTTAQIDVTFSNKIYQSLTNTTIYTIAKQPSAMRPICKPWDGLACKADLRILFTTPSTIINTQIINLSVLTTISIILSTAGTLWGSQDKIHAGIALVLEKVGRKKRNVDVASLPEP
jgi:hypothetical protein